MVDTPPEFKEQLIAVAQQWKNFTESNNTAQQWQRVFEEINETAKKFSAVFEAVNQELSKNFAPLFDPSAWIQQNPEWVRITKAMALLHDNGKRLEQAGWLPHDTMPFIKEGNNVPEGDISQFLIDYYRDHWPEVCQQLEKRMNDCGLDGEAKETFREALIAHGRGLYRCVCRVLFPEIERVVREVLAVGIEQGIASIEEIRKLADNNLTAHDVEPGGWYGFMLYEKLAEHSYEHVKSEERRQKFLGSSVPNRHAAIHGLIPYNSVQHSLNTIFLADFIFQIIAALKRRGVIQNGYMAQEVMA